MPGDALVGIDIGTTHTKGVLIGTAGQVHGEASSPSDLISEHPNWAEMEPEQWWTNTCDIAARLVARAAELDLNVAAVGISGMVPALVMLDDAGVPVRRSIQQNDARTAHEIEAVAKIIAPERFFELSGGSINQQVMAPKLRWLSRHEPEALERARVLLGSYDYVTYRLTGTLGVEHNWALESGLANVHTGAWEPELVAAAGIDERLLPTIHPSHAVVGEVTADAAQATGLAAGTPVIAGVADHVASAFAAGVTGDGDLLIKFGGAGDILYSTQALVTDARLFIDYHVVPGRYLLNGCMATSGSMLKWLVREFFEADAATAQSNGMDVFAFLDARASQYPPGSQAIVVLPYFLGEKTPIHDPHARGTILGLGLHHDRYALYRAFLEAVVFGFAHHVEVLRERGLDVRRVLASDGGARSDVWLQIAADVLGVPVHRVGRHPGSSLGAAFVAGKAMGLIDGWDAIEQYTEVLPPFEPQAEANRVYGKAFGVYRDMYERLKSLYPTLGAIAEPSVNGGTA